MELYEEEPENLLDWGLRRGAVAPAEFFAQNPYFRIEEFTLSRPPAAARKALNYHVKAGHLTVVRKGTYVWSSLASAPDPFLLGTRLVPGAVVSHASALWWHEILPAQETLTITSHRKMPPFAFAGRTYRAVVAPRHQLDEALIFSAGVKRQVHNGQPLDVCSPERAFVDCLDRIDVSPDLEALWRAFTSRKDPFDGAEMVRYALELGNRVTCAKVGLFVQVCPRMWTRNPGWGRLLPAIPKAPALADPGRYPSYLCRYRADWRLLLPAGFYRVLFPGD